MNTMGPPPRGQGSAAAHRPAVVQQTTVIHVGSPKSVGAAVLLGLLFGPLGMLYATIPGALVMMAISFIVAIATLGLGLLITTPICAIWAGMAASSHNKRLQGVATVQAAMPTGTAATPADWYDDPQGSGRLRYHDGVRWTDHYAERSEQGDSNGGEQPAPRELEPARADDAAQADGEAEPRDEAQTDEEAEAPTAVADAQRPAFCGACGQDIAATARFCPACGQAQEIA